MLFTALLHLAWKQTFPIDWIVNSEWSYYLLVEVSENRKSDFLSSWHRKSKSTEVEIFYSTESEMTRRFCIEFSNLLFCLSEFFSFALIDPTIFSQKRIANTLNHWIKGNRFRRTKLGIYANRMKHTEVLWGNRLSLRLIYKKSARNSRKWLESFALKN